MKKIVTLFAALVSLAAVFAAPTITGVTAQQRYPWNGKVDIAYTVNGDIAAHCKDYGLIPSLKVTATDKAANKTYTATSLSGDTKLAAGTHKIVWDMDAQGISFKSANVVFNVACATTEATYCVIDLSAGANATSYPVTYLASEPSGGFNVDTYKTKKLVLKRIAAGSFIMGGDQNDQAHKVTLTKPFYMGLFEVTQKQWTQITGRTTTDGGMPVSETRPAQRVSFTSIRGSNKGLNGTSEVDDNSAVQRLRSRSGLNFDLPTQAQWEYACRAGTTTQYPWGESWDDSFAWSNTGSSAGGAKVVGGKKSNSWGLYDMCGNVWEWCLDGCNGSGGWEPTFGVDPLGWPQYHERRVIIGGGGNFRPSPSLRYAYLTDWGYGDVGAVGFRLCITLP